MADTSHLERMGRELKCPICLSLLNSAVSLTCNHVFCGSCIGKSMKSISNCPVCKVPFRRREIRPAPHMDNLVSIYKSMETASGVNIFVTQTFPLTKFSDYENQHDGDKVCGVHSNSKTYAGASALEHQEQCEKKGCTRSSKAKPGSICIDAEKPSFPTKKRVHVPQFPPSETPKQPEKSKNETRETAKSGPDKNSRMQKDQLVINENEEPVFTPFFWLRDDDGAEKVTQQTDGDLIRETPPDIPCFSDIKDSDDEIACESNPNMATCLAPCEADFFDSEMFEWTQRPCSPELYSSPVRMQVLQIEDTSYCEFQERNIYTSEHAAAPLEFIVENRDIMMNEKEADKADLASSSSPRNRIIGGRSKKSVKRDRKAVQKSKNKRTKRTASKASGAPKVSGNITGQHMRKTWDEKGNASDVIKRSIKRKQKVSIDASVTETSENLCSLFGAINSPAASFSDVKKYKRSNLKKSSKIREGVSLQKGLGSKLTAAKMKAAKDSMILSQCQVLISNAPKRSTPEEKEAFNKGMVIRKCEIESAKKKKDFKKVKFLEQNKSDNNLVDNSQSWDISGKVTAKDTQKLRVLEGNSNGLLNKASKVDDEHCSSSSILDRSKKSPNGILCAFCQSAEESEATGIMVNYLEGKPVAGDQIGGSKVIHSHKNCTEWAPNVFFQDDSVINLESELMRSRRIKCSFCGIKGAALGCYKKSCRKSFHVPCAKVTPECRWDYDNFVMLCPLHASSKLPSEVHISQSNLKRKSVHQRTSDFHQSLLVRDENKVHLQWKSHIQSKNLVLCCSGLTEIEKGIISEFQKLSGVKVLKNWDLSVTHVIASTDENGACKRTLKFLMGILEGKWILAPEWVRACTKFKRFVDEKYYEIEVDVHGIRHGPCLGRLRVLDKKPKLFNGYKFYFMGDFAPSYKRYLNDLVIAGGGTILNRKPISQDPKNSSGCVASITFIIYSREPPEKCEPAKITSTLYSRHLGAKALAGSTGAVAVSNSWILNSIAGCKLQNLTE